MPFDESVREFLQAAMDDHGFMAFLGVTVDEVEPGRLVLRVPYDEKLTNPGYAGGGRSVHGGVASTIADTSGGLAIRSTLPNPASTGVATIDLNVSYLRPAVGDLVADASVVRIGSTVGVAEISIESETPEEGTGEVAVARGSYRIFRPE